MTDTKSQSGSIKEQTRQKIIAFLPDAMKRALESYKTFAEKDLSDEKSGTFKEHHAACKVAIAHVELLTKLARWADVPEEAAPQQEEISQADLAAMVRKAQKEVERHKNQRGG